MHFFSSNWSYKYPRKSDESKKLSETSCFKDSALNRSPNSRHKTRNVPCFLQWLQIFRFRTLIPDEEKRGQKGGRNTRRHARRGSQVSIRIYLKPRSYVLPGSVYAILFFPLFFIYSFIYSSVKACYQDLFGICFFYVIYFLVSLGRPC